MTDTAAARAYPPEPDEGPAPSPMSEQPRDAAVVETFPPAAHTHALGEAGVPAISPSTTAVLDSQPPLGFPGEASITTITLGSAVPPPEPPPFGFNAPGRPQAPERPAFPDHRDDGDEPSTTLAGLPAPPPPSASSPWAPPPARRGAVPPRELMPSVVPMQRHRIGEAPTPSFGPPGRERSTAAMVLLCLLTLGFYAIAWHRRVNQEMGDFDPRIHVHPARSAWAVALPLVAGVLASLAAAAIVVVDHMGIVLNIPVTVAQAYIGLGAIAAVPYVVMLLPFSMVAVAMTAERVRVVEDHAGLTTDEQLRPASLVGWLIFPLVGGLVVMAREQQCLNRIWRLARS